jgi:D-serine deaminase-like pyridoxal phosphate-dependent protein
VEINKEFVHLTITDLDTPSLVIDCHRMEANIAAMQARCDSLGIALRPHIKTHKVPEIARLQLQAGAAGIACQKVTEAEIFADAGFDDILIPYNIVGAHKTARLAALAARCRVSVSADDPLVIAGLAKAAAAANVRIEVLVDVATDLQRTGTSPERVVDLARQITDAPGLHFAGLMILSSGPANRAVLIDASHGWIRRFPGANRQRGGTPAAMHAHEVPELTELRVGTYLSTTVCRFRRASDARQLRAEHPGDGGQPSGAGADHSGLQQQTLSSDHLNGLYGTLLEYRPARYTNSAKSTPTVDVSGCEARPPSVSVSMWFLVHVCTAVNLADFLYGVRSDQVESVWKVAARGKVW